MNTIFFIFLLVFSGLYVAVHYYIYTRTSSGLALKGKQKTALKYFILCAGLAFLAGEFLIRRKFPLWLKPAVFASSIWGGALLIAFTLFVMRDVCRIFFKSRAFEFRSTVAVLVLLFGLSFAAIINVAAKPATREIKIVTSKLPENMKQFTIVHLSDLHLNFLVSEKWLEYIVRETNRLNPDLVVISGDLIDGHICEFNNFCLILQGLKSKYGVVAVTGNHEFYVGMDNFNRFAKSSGIEVLRNAKKIISNAIEIIGIDDDEAYRFYRTKSDLQSLLKDSVGERYKILVYHRPTRFEKHADMGIDLQLSGHTHAGQLPPADLIVKLIYKYVAGFYSYKSSHIYTSPGTGTWGPPMRLFSRSEIAKIVLINGKI